MMLNRNRGHKSYHYFKHPSPSKDPYELSHRRIHLKAMPFSWGSMRGASTDSCSATNSLSCPVLVPPLYVSVFLPLQYLTCPHDTGCWLQGSGSCGVDGTSGTLDVVQCQPCPGMDPGSSCQWYRLTWKLLLIGVALYQHFSENKSRAGALHQQVASLTRTAWVGFFLLMAFLFSKYILEFRCSTNSYWCLPPLVDVYRVLLFI